MDTKQKTKGSWGVRFFVLLLGVVLGVLFFWLLSFIEGDIGTMAGPDREAVRRRFVEASLDTRREGLSREIETLDRKIKTLSEQQHFLSSSTDGLQNTITQLLAIQKESLVKNVEFSEKSKQTLQESQSAFLENQQKFQQYNREIAELTALQRQQEDARVELAEVIRAREIEADQEFRSLYKTFQFKVAAMKLAFLVPVFVASSFLFLRFRAGAYWPLVWAIFLASFLKAAMVAHDYFPRQYFKYIALLVVIGIVVRFLVYLIRMIVAPKKELLLKQYQQHYDKCICPVCSKPIRSGPLRFLGALGRKARVMAGPSAGAASQEPYTCPACGTGLYGTCRACGQVRHTLLPYCEHCGDAAANVNL